VKLIEFGAALVNGSRTATLDKDGTQKIRNNWIYLDDSPLS
jgi:hypothetical protein